MESVEVLIVGGGPAGSSCARRLRQAGLDPLVVDRAAFPRDKPCAGWITLGTLETLGLTPGAYAAGATLQPFTGFRTGRIGGPFVETRYGRVVAHGILRRELDHHLLASSGARVRTGVAVERLRRTPDGWVVDERIRARILVGAGGHFCPVARAVNGAADAERVVVAAEAELRLGDRERERCRVEPETPELAFCADLRGYGWCVRKGEHLNLGLGRWGRRGLPAQLRAFVDGLVRSGRIGPELAARFRGHAYRLYLSTPRRVVDTGVLLVGDAAGLAAPASGEGIRQAIESGLLAAEAILQSGGRAGPDDLAPYAAALKTRFGPRRRQLGIPGPLARAISPLLLGSSWLARRVILDRLFLQESRPPLGLAAPVRRAA